MAEQTSSDLVNATKAQALNIGALTQIINDLTAQIRALFP